MDLAAETRDAILRRMRREASDAGRAELFETDAYLVAAVITAAMKQVVDA